MIILRHLIRYIFIVGFIMLTTSAFSSTQETLDKLFREGIKASQSGDWLTAEKSFQQIVTTDPKDLEHDYYITTYSEAYYDLGMVALQTGRFLEAKKNFQQALVVVPTHIRSLYYLASVEIALGQLQNARTHYEQVRQEIVLTDLPGGEDFVGAFLKHFVIKGFEEGVLSVEYQPLLKDIHPHPLNIQLTYDVMMADTQLVITVLQGIERTFFIDKPFLTKADIRFMKMTNDGQMIFERWTIDDGKTPPLWVSYNFRPPSDFQGTVEVKLYSKEPSTELTAEVSGARSEIEANAYLQGMRWAAEGKWEEAEMAFTADIDRHPDKPDSYFQRGTLNVLLGKPQSGIYDFTQAISLNPQFADAYGNRGYTYLQLKEFDKALADLTQAIRLKPHQMRPYLHRSQVYFLIGQYK